jgi:ribosomal-protein-alanine N-acetyltransferase
MELLPISPNGVALAPEKISGPAISSAIEANVSLYASKGYNPPWIGYIAMENDIPVGSCGFAGSPTAGEAEIAYFTFPEYERSGVATRMARELLANARPAAGTSIKFIAHTLPQEGASTAILRKLGFSFVGEVVLAEDGTVWKWREA